ncbi:MAG: glutaredoxin family protein [Solirubrobacterales bacterium]|nr:glutaredoxin family protein [Solirubrobacterales bacterium]
MNEAARSGHPVRVRMLARQGCHLCDEALAELKEVLLDFPGTELEVIDIESDDDLHRLHLERIPVVEVEGREICVIYFEPEAVREALGSGKVR